MNKEIQAIRELAGGLGRTVRLMEVCGTHTMAAFRSGLRSLLPANVQLLSGPGCPVCVTPIDYVDQAVALAQRPDTVVATFGDMIRVPGTEASLEQARARGAQVRVVYSPLDALAEARANPGTAVVFLGVGFETTAPTTAWALREAARDTPNFYVLCGHKTMPQAMAALLDGGEVCVDGFLCPGHVSVIIGSKPYEFIPQKYGLPCVVAGFEGEDMAAAIRMALKQLAEGRAEVEVQYTRSVTREGNAKAQAAIREVFEDSDAAWRGLGTLPGSGLRIRGEFSAHDAERLLAGLEIPPAREPAACRCGDVLRGACAPPECPLFGTLCTPGHPVGACMVSSEGTCAAYYQFREK
ncbi:MAG: hydrogenase formation protein HypD [Verrucomicrobia bacterium]|nr:hydrogenase formation protein HypD [Verrucomicrobiota bacterium]MBU1910754.1 hydrogenase formation protein HypD [Verrucomicrobiota bacterium]